MGSIKIENVIETIGLHKPDFLFPNLKNKQLEDQLNWLVPDFVDSDSIAGKTLTSKSSE